MNDEWWIMNDGWWMMNDGWWMMNYLDVLCSCTPESDLSEAKKD